VGNVKHILDIVDVILPVGLQCLTMVQNFQ